MIVKYTFSPGDQPDPINSICDLYYRRVIDKQVKPGSRVVFIFDPYQEDEDSTNVQCFGYICNGQLNLNSAEQKPIALMREDSNSTALDCRNVKDIMFQILTVQWIWRINGGDEHIDDLGTSHMT